jgi:hypothetical protein
MNGKSKETLTVGKFVFEVIRNKIMPYELTLVVVGSRTKKASLNILVQELKALLDENSCQVVPLLFGNCAVSMKDLRIIPMKDEEEILLISQVDSGKYNMFKIRRLFLPGSNGSRPSIGLVDHTKYTVELRLQYEQEIELLKKQYKTEVLLEILRYFFGGFGFRKATITPTLFGCGEKVLNFVIAPKN